jgi:hypothetical protein
MKVEALRDAWRRGNEAGRGYSVGPDDGDINDLASELGELVVRSFQTDQPAVYRRPDGTLVGVGDANGPWAVDLGAEPR